MQYKVSYKVLSQQGEDLKAVAKLVDGYTERVNQIYGKLGQDEMLAAVQGNLQKLSIQLGESRAIINMAGEVLAKSVESYTAVETSQVQQVDSLKAHNRDFYQNPVAVASAGGAAAGAAAGMTINTTIASSSSNYTVATESSAAPSAAGIAAGAGALGAVAGAGAVLGAVHLKKQKETEKTEKSSGVKKQEEPEAKGPAASDKKPETLTAGETEQGHRPDREGEA